MKIRALILTLLGLGLAGVATSSAMDDMAQQEAMMRAAIRRMPKEKIREIAEMQFAGEIQAANEALMNSIRWLVVEGALAALLHNNPIALSPTTTITSHARNLALGGLYALGLGEVLNLVGNARASFALHAKQEDFYRHLMSMRAGADMVKQDEFDDEEDAA